MTSSDVITPEMITTLGVHGPRTVEVVLLD